MSDQLLVGELKNFPPEAQQKIETAGGLKPFLLESLRFVMYGELIGLMSHAVCLQHSLDDDASLFADFPSPIRSMDDSESKGSSHLNPTAKEFLPQFQHLSLSDSSESYDLSNCPVLPSPYIFVSPNLNYPLELQDVPETVKPDVQDSEYPDYFPNIQLNTFNTEALSTDSNYIHFNKDVFVQVRSFKNPFILHGAF